MFLFNRSVPQHYNDVQFSRPVLDDLSLQVRSNLFLPPFNLNQAHKFSYDNGYYLNPYGLLFIKKTESFIDEDRNIGTITCYEEKQISHFESDNFNNKNTQTNDI